MNPVQKAQGIKDSRKPFIADGLKDGLGINHTELLDVLYRRGNDTVKFVTDCGAESVPNKMLFEGGHSVPRSYEIKAGSGCIVPMYETLSKMKNCVMKTRTKFDDFVLDKDGRVTGVVCREGYRFTRRLASDDVENKTGHRRVYKARKGMMPAAGGFSRDIWFRQVQDPRVVPSTDSTNQPGATAGVLLKALEIGATPLQISWLQFLPYCNPHEDGFGVSVNFTNHACMDEHAGRKIKTDAELNVIGKDRNYPVAVCDDSIVKAINPSFVKAPLAAKTAFDANTLEEIADHFGIKKDAFLAKVKRFNQCAKEGEDKDFHRILKFNNGLTISKPPFCGVEVAPKIHHTTGGLLINPEAQVISSEDSQADPRPLCGRRARRLAPGHGGCSGRPRLRHGRRRKPREGLML